MCAWGGMGVGVGAGEKKPVGRGGKGLEGGMGNGLGQSGKPVFSAL